jgi:hypothetical protein
VRDAAGARHQAELIVAEQRRHVGRR